MEQKKVASDSPHSSDPVEKITRACLYVRVSTASRTRRGDTLTFDQDSAVGLRSASIPTERVVPKKDVQALTPS
ncbi:MAG: hypothetical protein DMG58_32190 [Acidobacteria bacterium]|nr:MAG: hypothetical protein DMG58_32190 [Acidobacteriota bacterium]